MYYTSGKITRFFNFRNIEPHETIDREEKTHIACPRLSNSCAAHLSDSQTHRSRVESNSREREIFPSPPRSDGSCRIDSRPLATSNFRKCSNSLAATRRAKGTNEREGRRARALADIISNRRGAPRRPLVRRPT